jgi:hypothetical protein
MIHGEFEIETDRARYSPAQLASFAQQGVKVEDGPTPAEVILAVPLNVAFFNPGLLKQIGVGPTLQSLSGEPQYKNEEMIDNQLRSVLFQVPKPGNTTCIEPVDPVCYSGVLDLGVLDIVRAREHGIPNYNGLRQAYGLAPRTNFRTITGESSESYPNDPMLPPGHETDSPRSIDFTALHDRNGAPIALDSPVSQTQAVMATRRTPLAARLKAVYKTVDQVDAFTGMISEPHVNGSEFGELQLAIWKKQFQALRDGDRFFFGNDPLLSGIQRLFGIDFRHTLGQVIAANTDIPATELRPNVFVVPADEPLAQSRILGTGSGRCLDVASASQNNGTRVQLGDCNGSLGQGWNQLQTGQLHVFDSKCLSMPAHATRPGSPVVISDCTNQSNQVFKFNGNGTIVGVESGLCLTPHGGGTGPSTPIEIQTCTGSPQQRWMR